MDIDGRAACRPQSRPAADEVELEFDRHPGGELEGDVLVGVSAAVTARSGPDTDGAGGLCPLFDGEYEAVQPGLTSNPIEFDGIEIRAVELLPDADELDGAPVPEPLLSPLLSDSTMPAVPHEGSYVASRQ